MINVTHVRYIGTKRNNDLAQSPPGFGGINGMGCEFGTHPPSVGGAFEVDVCQKILVIGCGLATRIGHGKKRDLVSLSFHQFHEFEQINFSAAEGKVVFIAV